MDIFSLFKEPKSWVLKDGYYIKVNSNQVSSAYTAQFQDSYTNIESDSWWFRYKGSVVTSIINKYFVKVNSKFAIIDIGGGDGYFSRLFSKNGYETVLLEPSQQACFNAQKVGGGGGVYYLWSY